LEGAAGGGYVSWYAAFARAPLVIGYDPHSRFASRFRSQPWYRVIAEPGIRVGATDPKLDPKGKLTLAALQQAASVLHEPSLARASSGFAIFPEESLMGRLQAGQLDAGFFYANEAREQGIPVVPLSPASAAATYTVTVLNGAPDARGAQAFVAFLLGKAGRAIMASSGLTVLRPTLSGPAAAVPAALQTPLAGG
jgi:molybdate/tungstate transport system substrate-binding protein